MYRHRRRIIRFDYSRICRRDVQLLNRNYHVKKFAVATDQIDSMVVNKKIHAYPYKESNNFEYNSNYTLTRGLKKKKI